MAKYYSLSVEERGEFHHAVFGDYSRKEVMQEWRLTKHLYGPKAKAHVLVLEDVDRESLRREARALEASISKEWDSIKAGV